MKDYITNHFTRSELECHCGCHGLFIDSDFLEALEELRVMYNAPIVPSCVCRCVKHNKSLPGSSPKSQHIMIRPPKEIGGSKVIIEPRKCCAIDIPCARIQAEQLISASKFVQAFHDGGLGRYNWGAHFDTGRKRSWDRRTK